MGCYSGSWDRRSSVEQPGPYNMKRESPKCWYCSWLCPGYGFGVPIHAKWGWFWGHHPWLELECLYIDKKARNHPNLEFCFIFLASPYLSCKLGASPEREGKDSAPADIATGSFPSVFRIQKSPCSDYTFNYFN